VIEDIISRCKLYNGFTGLTVSKQLYFFRFKNQDSSTYTRHTLNADTSAPSRMCFYVVTILHRPTHKHTRPSPSWRQH